VLWGVAATACGGEGSSPASQDVAAGEDGLSWPAYEGSFSVTVVGQYHVAMTPILVRLEARDPGGFLIADYQGRVGLSQAVILRSGGDPEPEAFFTVYDEWGNRPEKTGRGMGGFVGGVGNFPATFVAVRPKEPEYAATLTFCDLKSPDMCGSVELAVHTIPAGRQEYMEVGPDYDAPPVEAGSPSPFRFVARNGQNSLGFELQNLFVDTVELFSAGSKSITPATIEDYSAKADEYGVLVQDVTFSDPGKQQLVALWMTPGGLYRSSQSQPIQVAPAPVPLAWKQADLDELSPVVDIWASPEGTYVAFEFGRLYLTADGGKTFTLVQDFGKVLRGVGHHYQYPDVKDGVCVLADLEMRCECPSCYNWAALQTLSAEQAKRVLCLPGHPNKDMTCYIHPDFEYERHIKLKTAWGIEYETALYTSGSTPQTGVLNGSITQPWFEFPWGMAQDAAQEVLYVANRSSTEIAFTLDKGSTWGRLQGDLPQDDGISFLAFDERYRVLYAGTDATGLWLAAVDDTEDAK
jgi:hypothetical protein